MEKQNYIQTKDLRDIMEAIADAALKHADKIETSVTFHAYAGKNYMEVMTRKAESFEQVNKTEYIVIDEISNDVDVLFETIGAALATLKECETQSNIE